MTLRIPSLFQREHRRAIPILSDPSLQWVQHGVGLLTIKIDGWPCRLTADGTNWKIYRRIVVGDHYGFIKCNEEDPMDAPFMEALVNLPNPAAGYYEMYGPKVNGNPQGADAHYMLRVEPVDHTLIVQKSKILRGPEVSVEALYTSIAMELGESPIEGIVFHKEGAGMVLESAAKVTRKDFGLPWPVKGV